MLSRFIIWILLALVPFQSFAAVGVVQCPLSWSASTHVHHAVARQTSEDHLVSSADSQTPTHIDHEPSGESHTGAVDNAASHHMHKLPCCSNGAIIFSLEIALSSSSKRFTRVVSRQPVGLTSVYLEGPKRPPRATLV